MTAIAQLWIGDTSSTGSVDLLDGTNYTIPNVQSSIGGLSVPQGIFFGAVERGVVRGPTQTPGISSGGAAIPPTGTRPITIGLLCKGATWDAVEDNFNQILRFLERARLASGPFAQGTEICFRYAVDSTATNPVFWNVVGGSFLPTFGPFPQRVAPFRKYGTLTLYCLPYSHTAAVTDAASSTLLNGDSGSVLYRANVLGTVESLTATTLVDLSTGLSAPGGLALSQQAGTLGAGTYGYRVTACNDWGETTPCAEVQITIAASHGVGLTWNAVPHATKYGVYGRTVSGELFIAYSTTNSYTDNGSISPAGAMPASNTTTPTIVRATLGRLARLPSLSNSPLDFSGIFDATAVSPGVSSSDAGGNYLNNFARLATPSASWQTVAQISQPGTGAYQHGLFHPKLRVRDASKPLSPATAGSVTPAVVGGSLTPGTYSAYLTTRDGSGNESLPTALPPAVVGLNTNAGFFGAETGDFSDCTTYQPGQSVGTLLNGAAGAISIEADAAYTLSVANSQLGYRATSGAGMGAWATTSAYGGGNTGAIAFDVRINTDTAAASTTIWNGLPIVFDGSGNPLIWLINVGASYKFATLSGSTAVISGGAVGLSDGGLWQRVEIDFSWNGSTTYTMNVYINGVQTVTNQTVAKSVAPGQLGWGAGSVGAGTALQVDFDNVVVASSHIGAPTGRATWTWTGPAYCPAGAGYYLYVQRNGGSWWRFTVNAIGSASTTVNALTSGTASTGPPTGTPAVQPAVFRIGAGLTNSPTNAIVWSRPVSAVVCNSLWETLRFDPLALPPEVRQQGVANGSESTWVITVQALSNSAAPASADVDCAWLFPHTATDDLCAIALPGYSTSTAVRFVLDRRWDDQMSCHALQGQFSSTLVAAVPVRGRWSLGEGDDLIVSECEVANPLVNGGPPASDVVFAKYTLQNTLRFRYEHSRGVTY